MAKNSSIFVFVFLLVVNLSCTQINYNEQWPQFRGPYASGIVETTNLPETWNIETGENIKWKTDIPGLGHSSPIIWDNKIFVTTAINQQGNDSLKVGLYGSVANYNDSVIKEFRLICLDKNSGEILWNQLAHKGIPKTKRHTKASHADPTPATNGKYVVAFFGSNGLYCYDLNGKLNWEKKFEKMNAGYYYTPDMEWNVSSSPIIHEGLVIIQADNLNKGFLMAIDVETGQEKWKVERNDVSTYSVPTYYNKNEKNQVVVNGYKHIGGYDIHTGKEIWKMKGGGDIPVPTPFFAHNLIYIHSAHGKLAPIYAIKDNAEGDISLANDTVLNENMAWFKKRDGSYIPTSLVYEDYYYNLWGWNGKLSCLDAKTGEEIYTNKLPKTKGITASGIASDNKLYYCTELGDVFVVKAGTEFEILAKNPMNDVIMASPAISENTLYFRTQHMLVAVGK